MRIELDDFDLERLGAAIARNLPQPEDIGVLTLRQLAEQSGLSYEALRSAALAYEHGNPDGLKCMRATDGKAAPIQIKRSWFVAWSERQGSLNCRSTPIIQLQEKKSA